MEKKGTYIAFNIEEEMAVLPLWELGNGIYRLFLKEEIEAFKNGEPAVKTTKGFIGRDHLFRYASSDLKSIFFNDGNFILNTNIELEIEIRNRSVVSVKKL